MAWKIFRIGEANSRIDALEAENALLKSEVETLKAAPSAVTELQSKLTQAESDIATAKTTIGELEKANEELAVKLTETEASVESRASQKALEIASAQGAPPVKESPQTKSDDELRKQFQALPPGAERTAFYRKHKNILY